MKKIFLAVLLLSFCFPALAQKLECSQLMTVRVIAKSGMRMRSKPSLKSDVVVTVPYDSLLDACQQTFGQMTYEKITGYWRKVDYRGKIGYMFDGYLEVTAMESRLMPDTTARPNPAAADSTAKTEVAERPKTKQIYTFMTEAYNYCGDIRNIDPGLIWYGIYPADVDNGGTNYRIKPVEVQVVKSKYSVGKNLEFDIETNLEERSIFLIGSNRKMNVTEAKIPDNSEQLRYINRKVFPGQQLDLASGKSPTTLSATGTVENTGPCPDLKNYKLTLKGQKYGLPIDEELTKYLDAGECGMPEIYWYGDLNGDGIPEIIFVSVHEDRNHFTFFMSDPATDNELVHKQGEWTIDKCY